MTKDRTKELVHYIIDRCDDPKKLGATKLNKILWYADTFSYRKTGNPITQSAYIKRQHGPVPKDVVSILHTLANEGKIGMKEVPFFGRMKREFMSLSKADANSFTADELEIVNLILTDICNDFTASSISEASHDVAWQAAAMGEEIPLYAALVNEVVPLTEEDKQWAADIVAKHAKLKAA